MSISREQLIQAVRDMVAGEPWMLAAWLGGSDASGRTDPLSDVDLQLIVDDQDVSRAFDCIESMLEGIGGISHSWKVAMPTWHGHDQAVYMLHECPGHRCLDLLVMKRSSRGWFLEKERHGEPVVMVDRGGLLQGHELDRDEIRQRRIEMLAHHARSLPVLMEVVEKAMVRGHWVEVGIRYHAHVLRPLIDLMRCEHCPDRFDFADRYLDRDLPEKEHSLLEELALPAKGADFSRVMKKAREEIEDRLRRFQSQ